MVNFGLRKLQLLKFRSQKGVSFQIKLLSLQRPSVPAMHPRQRKTKMWTTTFPRRNDVHDAMTWAVTNARKWPQPDRELSNKKLESL